VSWYLPAARRYSGVEVAWGIQQRTMPLYVNEPEVLERTERVMGLGRGKWGYDLQSCVECPKSGASEQVSEEQASCLASS
jgi:hypothetical protein